MNAKELIEELKQVSPETEVLISTNQETLKIDRVVRSGYSAIRILTDD